MKPSELDIAVVGCGIGGAAVGALLQRAGFRVHLYEQAAGFAKVGAGIHLSPNLMKVMHAIGAAAEVSACGCLPRSFANRDAQDGRLRFDLPLGSTSVQSYADPFITLTRGDLHAAIMARLHPDSVSYGWRLRELSPAGSAMELSFEHGVSLRADLVIGADGLHSKVREALDGYEAPTFAGQVAFRGSYPSTRLGGVCYDDLTKWWAQDSFALTYFLDSLREVFYFAAMMPQPQWPHSGSSVEADPTEMLEAFADFHPDVVHAMRAAPENSVRKWALFERSARFVWGHEQAVLMGDACHPMRPFMSQGAAMALEDAAVLVRCLRHFDSLGDAHAAYVATRRARLEQMHEISSLNTFMRDPCDPHWVFGHDATRTDLLEPSHDALPPANRAARAAPTTPASRHGRAAGTLATPWEGRP